MDLSRCKPGEYVYKAISASRGQLVSYKVLFVGDGEIRFEREDGTILEFEAREYPFLLDQETALEKAIQFFDKYIKEKEQQIENATQRLEELKEMQIE